ncbi:MAG: RNA methyltransferase [Pseudomonadota bacterium]
MAAKQKKKPRNRKSAPTSKAPAALWLYGRHATLAALNNPARPLRRVLATQSALDWLADATAPPALIARIKPATAAEIDQALPPGAVHQGLAAEVDDLPRARLKDACADPQPGAPVIVLDQVTDPQNIGAIFRSAAAFNARAVIFQDRRTPPLAGALAKAAAGAIETVPTVSVVNIARAIEGLQGLGYHCAGLAGGAAAPIATLDNRAPLAIIMGAEGQGLRKLVADTCDSLLRIEIAPDIESLNVSTAAAIALYEATRQPQEGE